MQGLNSETLNQNRTCTFTKEGTNLIAEVKSKNEDTDCEYKIIIDTLTNTYTVEGSGRDNVGIAFVILRFNSMYGNSHQVDITRTLTKVTS